MASETSAPKEELSSPVGARLQEFLPAWEELTGNPWVLQTVLGHRLEFASSPPPPLSLLNPPRGSLSPEKKELMRVEIENLLLKGAVERVDRTPGIYSPIFLVPKRDEGWRPVINLRHLNSFLRVEHFKMENLMSLRGLLQKGDLMVKVDLKDAYLTVPIHHQDRKFLRFSWEQEVFQFCSLPFGLASAPQTFTKLLRPLLALLRSQGLRMVVYLDDILPMASSEELIGQHLTLLVSWLEKLGFVINKDKSLMESGHQIEFLG